MEAIPLFVMCLQREQFVCFQETFYPQNLRHHDATPLHEKSARPGQKICWVWRSWSKISKLCSFGLHFIKWLKKKLGCLLFTKKLQKARTSKVPTPPFWPRSGSVGHFLSWFVFSKFIIFRTFYKIFMAILNYRRVSLLSRQRESWLLVFVHGQLTRKSNATLSRKFGTWSNFGSFDDRARPERDADLYQRRSYYTFIMWKWCKFPLHINQIISIAVCKSGQEATLVRLYIIILMVKIRETWAALVNFLVKWIFCRSRELTESFQTHLSTSIYSTLVATPWMESSKM